MAGARMVTGIPVLESTLDVWTGSIGHGTYHASLYPLQNAYSAIEENITVNLNRP